VEILFQVAMEAAGWYQHYRQCRRKGKITMGKRKQILSLGFVPGPEMEAAIARRLFADDDGTLVDTHGPSIARNPENALISRVTDDRRQQEAFGRKLALLKTDLAGPNPTAIVKLLPTRVVLCWLDAYYMDMLSFLALQTESVDFSLSDYYQRRPSRAHRRLNSACKIFALPEAGPACERVLLAIESRTTCTARCPVRSRESRTVSAVAPIAAMFMILAQNCRALDLGRPVQLAARRVRSRGLSPDQPNRSDRSTIQRHS
jgi:hypothetical protein